MSFEWIIISSRPTLFDSRRIWVRVSDHYSWNTEIQSFHTLTLTFSFQCLYKTLTSGQCTLETYVEFNDSLIETDNFQGH
jgi:hypothetical protein